MIRIAKADSPVIIEYVGQPYCSSSDNWTTTPGVNVGVAKRFWKDAIVQYKWNINPDSLEIIDDVLFPSTYHVFMKTVANGA
jgi:hypothetical protein